MMKSRINRFLDYNHKNLINKFTRQFTSNTLSLPEIDVNKFLNKSQGWESECKTVSDCLHETGVLVIRDPVILF